MKLFWVLLFSIYTTKVKTEAHTDPDAHVISIDQSKRQRDSRLNKVMQDFDDDDDDNYRGNRKSQQKPQKSRKNQDSDEDDICAMMDRFNK